MLLLIFIFFLNIRLAYSLQPTFIRGTIFSAYNNSVINSATIETTAGLSTQTSSGTFYLRVPPNVYDLIVSAPGYCSNLLSGILAAPGQTATVTIWLIPTSTETGYVEGRVLDANTRNPVKGAFIITDLGGITTSGGDGYFKMMSPSGTATVTVAAHEFSSKTINTFFITPHRSQKLVVYLNKSASGTVPVKGIVRNVCKGSKINNAKIISTTEDSAAGNNGLFEIETMSGSSTLLSSAQGYQYAYKTVVLPALPVGATINFNLIPAQNGIGLLQGRITDSQTQEPLAGTRIEADKGGISFSKPDGTFLLFTSICTTRVIITREGFTPYQTSASVSFNSSTVLNVSLEPLGSIAGSIADNRTDNHAILGARISLDELPEIAAISSDNGSYMLKNIPPGLYTVSASHTCYVPVQHAVSVDTGNHLQENFILAPSETGDLQGHITDKFSGLPLDKARISTDHGAYTESDAQGFYSLRLPGCPTTVTVDADGYFTRFKRNMLIEDNKTLNFDASLIPCLFCDLFKRRRFF